VALATVAARLADFDETCMCQLPECFSDGRARYAEALGEHVLIETKARLKFTGQHRSCDLVGQSSGLGARFRLRCFHGQISVCIIFMHAANNMGVQNSNMHAGY
jgi:hypothetical protein